MMNNKTTRQNKQRGGVILGIIMGVLVGLGVALAVAVYVMKVPTPFNNKSANRSAEQDAAESKKNKDWDPNAALLSKPTVKTEARAKADAPAAAATKATTSSAPTPAAQAAPTAPSPQATSAKPAQPASPVAPAFSGLPATVTGSTETEYFVQVAAFSNEADAQAMRGKLALAGFEGRIVEREQSGRTVYRVRTGPFGQAAGDKAKASLEAAGFDTVLVRSQK